MKIEIARTSDATADVAITNGHIIDFAGFETNYFTPFAALNPGVANRYQKLVATGWRDIEFYEWAAACASKRQGENNKYRVSITGQTAGQHLLRGEQLVKLLHMVSPGLERETEFISARHWVGSNKTGGGKARVFDVFRKSDLAWRTKWEREFVHDFRHYLQTRYLYLGSDTAWRLAWAFVRAAYCNNMQCVELLLKAVNPETDLNNGRFEAILEDEITKLKSVVLT